MSKKYKYVKLSLATGEFCWSYMNAEKPLADYYYELGTKYQIAFLTSRYDYKLKQWIVSSGSKKKRVIAIVQLDDEQATAAEKHIADRVSKILTEEHFCY